MENLERSQKKQQHICFPERILGDIESYAKAIERFHLTHELLGLSRKKVAFTGVHRNFTEISTVIAQMCPIVKH